MKVLVAGAQGLLAQKLIEALTDACDGRADVGVSVSDIFIDDGSASDADLASFCERADFVFHLDGLSLGTQANYAACLKYTNKLLAFLNRANNDCPVALASCLSASGIGEFAGSGFGAYKLAEENLFFNYSQVMNVDVLVYRFHEILDVTSLNGNGRVGKLVFDAAYGGSFDLESPMEQVTFICADDAVREMLCALAGNAHHCDFLGLKPAFCDEGQFCAVHRMYETTLCHVAEVLGRIKETGEVLAQTDADDGLTAVLATCYTAALRLA